MSILVIFSLIVKCIGAVLEIGSQALVSQLWSVEIYGEYAFFVALADGFYALFFSGIIKFNNFFIPRGECVKFFRKKYYKYYVIPICLIGIIVGVVLKKPVAICAFFAGFTYLCAMDTSSRMMSYGRYKPALIGEYCIGRTFVVLAVLVFSLMHAKNLVILYLVYGMQFFIALIYYFIINKKNPFPEQTKVLDNHALSKYAVFQSTEIAHTIIMQSSVIVQYIFGGAFQTALISIVLVVRKLINFISGPTSKLYQPEFSKRFNAGDRKGLSDVYAQITRIQLCFMMPVFMLLIAKPEIILRVFNRDLIEYGWLVRITAIVFISMIAFGPLSNFLPMIGHERIDSIINWTSVFVMYLSMIIFRSNQYFVVIGFCAQLLYVNIVKLIVFVRYMKRMPMPAKDYFLIVMLYGVCSVILQFLPENLVLAFVVCAMHFAANFIIVFPKEDFKDIIQKMQSRKRKNG